MTATTSPLKSRSRHHYSCIECGTAAPKWSGRCDGCGEWNTIVEEPPGSPRLATVTPANPVVRITEVSSLETEPVPTGIAEFDRVLGGGLVPGSVTLVGGEPGVGKSTLLLQVLVQPARDGATVLYVSGEESAQQIRRRAERLGAVHDGIFLAAETNLAHVLAHI